MQGFTCQGMIQIQQDTLGANIDYIYLYRLPRGVSHTKAHAWFQVQIWGKHVARDHFKGVRVVVTITVGRLDHYLFLIVDSHPI